ncbi:hypothetical protein KIN20_009525 [Parelaphostrongylus tenuis]|uniref:Uncharacterized protein n=1 Tax=Parelaphostrongylus tenuis TaxID=148309 RepID=A0AAD5M9M9_PARTN|nr:hypothetical protein KIN20_009525 [Parelaphostrongylus tenuis]
MGAGSYVTLALTTSVVPGLDGKFIEFSDQTLDTRSLINFHFINKWKARETVYRCSCNLLNHLIE